MLGTETSNRGTTRAPPGVVLDQREPGRQRRRARPAYLPSAARRRKRTSLAAWLSWRSAGVTITNKGSPRVSTTMWRFRPLIFFPAS